MPSIQLQVDEALEARIRAEAARQNVSANQWIIDLVTLRLQTDEECEWRKNCPDYYGLYGGNVPMVGPAGGSPPCAVGGACWKEGGACGYWPCGG